MAIAHPIPTLMILIITITSAAMAYYTWYQIAHGQVPLLSLMFAAFLVIFLWILTRVPLERAPHPRARSGSEITS